MIRKNKCMKNKRLEWRTELRKVKDLIQYDKNPRTLNNVQMEGLQRSLKKFNIAELPCVNTDGTLVAGNQRVLALSLLGRGNEEIEVRVPNRKLSDKEFRDYLLTSNRSGGSWDFDKLASEFDIKELLTSGFDSFDLENIFDDTLEILDDEFEEEKEIEKAKGTDIKPGDYFALGRHRLLCSDSTKPENVQKLMDGVKVDAEWHTAGDSRVCGLCAPLDYKKTGRVWGLSEIKGKIPVHPLCRCVALPHVSL